MQSPVFQSNVTVSNKWEDFNGHMTVTGYLFYFNQSTIAFYENHGFGIDGAQKDGSSWFTLQQQITYLKEILTGDKIMLHVYPLEVDKKRIHFWVCMESIATGEMLATIEDISIYMNMNTRKSQQLPEEKLKMLEQLVQTNSKKAPPHIGKALSFNKKANHV